MIRPAQQKCKALFERLRSLFLGILQELDQCVLRDTHLSADADATELAAADQLIGCVAPDAEDRHQLLHTQRHGEVIKGAVLILHTKTQKETRQTGWLLRLFASAAQRERPPRNYFLSF